MTWTFLGFKKAFLESTWKCLNRAPQLWVIRGKWYMYINASYSLNGCLFVILISSMLYTA